MATAAKSKAKAPARKKRTKGTSDKIRALAAMSAGRKVGYLTLSDLTGGDDPKIENAINDLPRKSFKPGDTVYPSNTKSGTLYLLKSGQIEVSRTSANGQSHNVKNLFVADAAPFVSTPDKNPTLTIVALAIRQADYIADQMSKKQI